MPAPLEQFSVPAPLQETIFRLPAGEGREEIVAVPNWAIDGSIVVGRHGPFAPAPLFDEGARGLLEGHRWGSKRIFVTSAREGDGKTRTAFNLAAAVARLGKPVLLAEINFTDPQFRRLLGNLRFRYGIDTAVSGGATPEESVFSVHGSGPDGNGLGGLYVAAVRRPTPAESLTRCLLHLEDFFKWANEHFEMLIVDCPAVLTAEWDRWFHAFVGEALLVVREDRTPAAEVQKASRLLGSHLKGAWLNRFEPSFAALERREPARQMGPVGTTRSLESIRAVSVLLAHASGGVDAETQRQESEKSPGLPDSMMG